MVQRSGPPHCWCKAKRLRTRRAERCHRHSTRSCPGGTRPQHPRCALAAPSTTSCFTARPGSHKYRPKPMAGPAQGTPLVRAARSRLQVRCWWRSGTERGPAIKNWPDPLESLLRQTSVLHPRIWLLFYFEAGKYSLFTC